MKNTKSFGISVLLLWMAAGVMVLVLAMSRSAVAQDNASAPDKRSAQAGNRTEGSDQSLLEQIESLRARVAELEAALEQKQQGSPLERVDAATADRPMPCPPVVASRRSVVYRPVPDVLLNSGEREPGSARSFPQQTAPQRYTTYRPIVSDGGQPVSSERQATERPAARWNPYWRDPYGLREYNPAIPLVPAHEFDPNIHR